ncbi:hypothetical protein [Pseudomonas soli]|uniref:hypothetical protein n=1 Tax=Pseudomonas soli TaxID=1306993 RepID=UPI0037F19F4D
MKKQLHCVLITGLMAFATSALAETVQTQEAVAMVNTTEHAVEVRNNSAKPITIAIPGQLQVKVAPNSVHPLTALELKKQLRIMAADSGLKYVLLVEYNGQGCKTKLCLIVQ